MNIHQLSGYEILGKVKEGALPHPSMAATIPMKIVAVEKGMVEFEALAGDQHLNPMGGVHGGFAATVLDSVTGCTIHSTLAAGESYTTVDLNIKMLKPVPRAKALRARGRVINISKRIGISDATLTDAEGNIYAHATSTCMIFRNENRSNLIPLKRPDQKEDDLLVKSQRLFERMPQQPVKK